MSEKIRSVEEIIDGVIYIVDLYEDGKMTKRRKVGQENSISNNEREKLDTQMDLAYISDLMEINMEV